MMVQSRPAVHILLLMVSVRFLGAVAKEGKLHPYWVWMVIIASPIGTPGLSGFRRSLGASVARSAKDRQIIERDATG
jgi:hypothetical protein